MQRLCQAVATEQQVKSEVHKLTSELHKLNQKPELFNGKTRVFDKKEDAYEDRPAESKKVVCNAEQNLEVYAEGIRKLLDVTVTRDFGNCKVFGTLQLGGEKIENIPITTLLWLEKQANDHRKYVEELPVLDPTKNWKKAEGKALHIAEEVRTASNVTVKEPLILVQATERHPAQTTMVDKTVLVGYWVTQDQSSALTEERKKQLLRRADDFLLAVKKAREEANATRIEDVAIGEKILEYLLQ